MKQVTLSLADLGLLVGTRAAAGAGIALLLAARINPAQRRAIGWTLLALGALTTIPLAAKVIGKYRAEATTARRGQIA
jgi:hypothetical protein